MNFWPVIYRAAAWLVLATSLGLVVSLWDHAGPVAGIQATLTLSLIGTWAALCFHVNANKESE